VRNQCRPKIYTHDEDFYYYFLSFRCCAEPDGKPTDPRTPKQIKTAGSSRRSRSSPSSRRADAGEAELKKQGKCECKATDILCKTMCGTLLGPERERRQGLSSRALRGQEAQG
jgi:sulfatase modifying factor 1